MDLQDTNFGFNIMDLQDTNFGFNIMDLQDTNFGFNSVETINWLDALDQQSPETITGNNFRN